MHFNRDTHVHAHNIATHTIVLNFREENFRDQKANHEIHKIIVPQKLGATGIWYLVKDEMNFELGHKI